MTPEQEKEIVKAVKEIEKNTSCAMAVLIMIWWNMGVFIVWFVAQK